MKEKKYEIIIGQGNDVCEAADALEEEINSMLKDGYSLNGAPFLLESNSKGEGFTIAQCVLRN